MAFSTHWRAAWVGSDAGCAAALAPRPASRRLVRILLVNWQDRENPQAGGAEIHLHEIFGRLARRGHQVVLLCGGWPGCKPQLELDGMEVHRVGTRQTFALRANRYYKRELQRRHFDFLVE